MPSSAAKTPQLIKGERPKEIKYSNTAIQGRLHESYSNNRHKSREIPAMKPLIDGYSLAKSKITT